MERGNIVIEGPQALMSRADTKIIEDGPFPKQAFLQIQGERRESMSDYAPFD
jgi:hypothetical protein